MGTGKLENWLVDEAHSYAWNVGVNAVHFKCCPKGMITT